MNVEAELVQEAVKRDPKALLTFLEEGQPVSSTICATVIFERSGIGLFLWGRRISGVNLGK